VNFEAWTSTKPFELKAVEGFRGHRKHSPGIGMPAMPFDPPMKLTGLAKSEWNRLLSAAHWLRESESAALADRCLCCQRVQEAEAIIRRETDYRGESRRRHASRGSNREGIQDFASALRRGIRPHAVLAHRHGSPGAPRTGSFKAALNGLWRGRHSGADLSRESQNASPNFRTRPRAVPSAMPLSLLEWLYRLAAKKVVRTIVVARSR
jgi:hypothetical protein